MFAFFFSSSTSLSSSLTSQSTMLWSRSYLSSRALIKFSFSFFLQVSRRLRRLSGLILVLSRTKWRAFSQSLRNFWMLLPSISHPVKSSTKICFQFHPMSPLAPLETWSGGQAIRSAATWIRFIKYLFFQSPNTRPAI